MADFGSLTDFGLLDTYPSGATRDYAIARAHIRRARLAGVNFEYVSLAKVAERDRWICGICNHPVPQRWNPADPESRRLMPSLDHVIPVASGGAHTYGNTQLAHYGCNGSVHDKRLAAKLAKPFRPEPKAKVKAGKNDTKCIRGHELTGDNLLHASDGRRRCRACRQIRERASAADR